MDKSTSYYLVETGTNTRAMNTMTQPLIITSKELAEAQAEAWKDTYSYTVMSVAEYEKQFGLD